MQMAASLDPTPLCEIITQPCLPTAFNSSDITRLLAVSGVVLSVLRLYHQEVIASRH